MGWNRIHIPARLAALAGAVAATACLSVPGAAQTPLTATVSNSYLQATADFVGSFTVTDTTVTPAVVIMKPTTSFLIIRIDGGPPTTGGTTTPGWDAQFGSILNGNWIQMPIASPTAPIITARYMCGGGAAANGAVPPIEVDLTLTLVHDSVQYQFTVKNTDTRAHTVGLRFAQDYSVGANGPDGPVLTPTLPPIRSETDITGGIPPYWRAVDTAGTYSVGGTLVPPSSVTSTLIKPDRLVFAAPARFTTTSYDVTIDPNYTFDSAPGDAAAGVFFTPRLFGPTQSASYATYFGLQRSTINYDYPFAAGVDAAASMQIVPDPAHPEKTILQLLQPNPLRITAFVHNYLPSALSNVSASIQLPTGLALDTGETVTKSTASVAANGEGSFTWLVVPTGAASGRLSYSVSFSAGPGSLGKGVTRTIDLPSLPSQTFPGTWSMVSFPYNFVDNTPAAVLGLSSFDFDLWQWSPTALAYQAISAVLPGQGYWLNLHNTGRTITLPATATAVTSSGAPFSIPLKLGWNQIGNPFLYSVRWGEIQAIDTDVTDTDAFQALSVQKASDAQHQYILPTIYAYANGSYTWDQDFSTPLQPFVGYWVKALKPNITLLVTQPTGRAATVTRAAVLPTVKQGWSVRLSAGANGQVDSWNFLGVSQGASDGFDASDIEKPPASRAAVSLGFAHSNWDGRSGVYASDIQAANGGRKQWSVVVTSAAPNADITLNWTGMASVPRGTELFIVDPSTGARRQMRQTSALTVNTGSSGSRAVTIVAEPSSAAGAFRIMTWSVVRSASRAGGATISVTTTSDASLRIRVIRPDGSTVRNLGSRASESRSANVLWDYRDGKGQSVPIGQYLVEIVGTTPDGQTARVAIPHIVTR